MCQIGRRGRREPCEVWVQSLAASAENMGKGVKASLSSAHSRDSREALVLYCAWSKRREEEVGGRWSHRDITFSVRLFIICPLPEVWNVPQNNGLVCCVCHSIHSTWFLLDAQ